MKHFGRTKTLAKTSYFWGVIYKVEFCIQYHVILFHLIDCRMSNELVKKYRSNYYINMDHLDRNCHDDGNNWSWYGFSHNLGHALYHSITRSIKTTLNGYGKSRLDFGNCLPIGNATKNELSKKIEFDFNNGDTLELKGNRYAMIRFNNFTVLSCLKKE